MIKTENCKYCGGNYIPKRRGAQKFCSNSCRSLNWKYNQPTKGLKVLAVNSIDEKPVSAEKPSLQEKISLAAIGNAAAGVAAVELVKNFVTPNANKPATKKDIDELKIFLKSRYFLVKNMRRDIHGRPAYYDMITGNIVHI